MTIRHRLAAQSSVVEHLCDGNAVTHNPVNGVKRSVVEIYEGKTRRAPIIRQESLLDKPDADRVKGKRHRAILATLLHRALQRE